jgi:hypothetical protein
MEIAFEITIERMTEWATETLSTQTLYPQSALSPSRLGTPQR